MNSKTKGDEEEESKASKTLNKKNFEKKIGEINSELKEVADEYVSFLNEFVCINAIYIVMHRRYELLLIMYYTVSPIYLFNLGKIDFTSYEGIYKSSKIYFSKILALLQPT